MIYTWIFAWILVDLVLGSPVSLRSPECIAQTFHTISVRLSASRSASPNIQGYELHYGLQDHPVIIQTFKAMPDVHMVLNLFHSSVYKIQVIAIGSLGPEIWSDVAVCTTKQAVNASEPRHLKLCALSTDSFEATWDVSEASDKLQQYDVLVSEKSSAPDSSWMLMNTLEGFFPCDRWCLRRVSLSLKQLYFVKVRKSSPSQSSLPMSRIEAVLLIGGAPSQPHLDNYTVISDFSVNVSFSGPYCTGGGVSSYRLAVSLGATNIDDILGSAYRERRSASYAYMKELDASRRWHVIPNLRPFFTYSVVLSAIANGIEGPSSFPMHLVMPEAAPSVSPTIVNAIPRDARSINASWEVTNRDNINGVIRVFTVYCVSEHSDIPRVLEASPSASSIRITGLAPWTTYTLSMTMSTSRGEGPISNRVTVTTIEAVPDGAPTFVSATGENATAIQLRWLPLQAVLQNGAIIGYIIQYSETKDPSSQRFSMVTMETDDQLTSFVIAGLKAYTEYAFSIRAKNVAGEGPWSPSVLARTLPELTRPPNLNTSQSEREIVVTWSHPWVQSVDFYRLVISRSQSYDGSLEDTRSLTLQSVLTTHRFTDLLPGMWYQLKLALVVGKDSSQNVTRWVQTDESVPTGPPTNVRISSTSFHSLRLSWSPPDSIYQSGTIVFYQITYKVPGSSLQSEQLVSSKQLTYDITGLAEETDYELSVAAGTKIGFGPRSSTITARTTGIPIPTVSSLRVKAVSSSIIHVTWEPAVLAPDLPLVIKSYRVLCNGSRTYKDSNRVLRNASVSISMDLAPSTFEALIGSLVPATQYTVGVIVVTSLDLSSVTEVTAFTRKSAPPDFDAPKVLKDGVNQKSIPLFLTPASEINGPISSYQLFATLFNSSSGSSTFSSIQQSSELYSIATFPGSDLPLFYEFKLSDVKSGPLASLLPDYGAMFRFFLQAVTVDDEDGLSQTSTRLSDAVNMAALPVSESQTASSGGTPTVLIIVLVVVLLCMIVAVVVGVRCTLLHKRRKQKAPGKADELCQSQGLLLNRIPSELQHPRPSIIGPSRVEISNFESNLQYLKQNDKLRKEFLTLDDCAQYTMNIGRIPFNQSKNRILREAAFDHTRVELKSTGELGSDYINANYVDGYLNKKVFIAAQAPTPDTVLDFWRMIWEKEIDCIAMLTVLAEFDKVKSEQYWPSRGSAQYGRIFVKLIEECPLTFHTKRLLQASMEGDPRSREIVHFQLTAWPDFGPPVHPYALLQFVRLVRLNQQDLDHPLLVHCSTGSGRTGCFIAVDCLLDEIAHLQSVDVLSCVQRLRHQRALVVKTDDQYMMIYETLLESVLITDSRSSLDSIHRLFKKRMDPIYSGGPKLIDVEYITIAKSITQSTKMSSDTMHSGSQHDCLPYNFNRVHSMSPRVYNSRELNATFIDGYNIKHEFITMPNPSKENVEDFWVMVLEQDVDIIVTLMTDQDCLSGGVYWPTDRPHVCMLNIITLDQESRLQGFTIRVFSIANVKGNGTRLVRQLQFHQFNEDDVPVSTEVFSNLISHVNKFHATKGPILVHCTDGARLSGLFCTVWVIRERLRLNSDVDIYETVRVLRLQRPNMISNLQQYHFCYRGTIDFYRSCVCDNFQSSTLSYRLSTNSTC